MYKKKLNMNKKTYIQRKKYCRHVDDHYYYYIIIYKLHARQKKLKENRTHGK